MNRSRVMKIGVFLRIDSRELPGHLRNAREIFLNEFPGEFRRGFFGGFFEPFSIEKTGGKKSTPKSMAKLKS